MGVGVYMARAAACRLRGCARLVVTGTEGGASVVTALPKHELPFKPPLVACPPGLVRIVFGFFNH